MSLKGLTYLNGKQVTRQGSIVKNDDNVIFASKNGILCISYLYKYFYFTFHSL